MKTTHLLTVISVTAVLVCGCREIAQTSQSGCASEPTGTVIAAIEDESGTDVMRVTGTVESVTPKGEGVDRIVVTSGDRRYTVVFGAAGKPLPVIVSQRYVFEIQHKPGYPTACSIVVSDETGMLFAGVTDWSLGVNVMPDGPAGFELNAGESECESRPHGSCYESITNTPLSVSYNGESISLFHGESGKLSEYLVTCLTCQDVVYTSTCADAGLSGVSYIIERASD
jgi:hypothetical protein